MTDEAEFDMEEDSSFAEDLREYRMNDNEDTDDGGSDEDNRVINDILCGNIQNIPTQQSSVYRIFLSSTFTGLNNSWIQPIIL